MKQLRKKIVAVLCVVAMLGGIVLQNGIVLDTKAADTQGTSVTDDTAREWYVYGNDAADTGLVVADTANGVTSGSISDAGVNLPDGLIQANLELQIKLKVEGNDLSTLNGNGVCFELCNELNDCGELNWVYNGFVSGDNTVSLAFKDAGHTNGSVVNGKGVQDGKSPFDWQETINYFRCYQIGNPSNLKITINEIKIVYTDAGLTFGADDTSLQLDKPMNQTPNAVEATVNMDKIDNRVKWPLHSGTSFSGVSMGVGSYTTTSSDTPGAGMECFVLDASGSAISGFEALQHSLAIDASAYSLENLAVGFWVYSSTAGTLATGYDNGQIRLSSNADNMSGNCLFYYMYEISVNAGWNYVEIPLSSMKDDIKQGFTLSNINTWGIAAGFQVPQGRKIYFGDMELIATADSTEDSTEDNNVLGTLRSGSDTEAFYVASGHKLTTGVTTASDAPGAGMTYSILDASTTAVNRFNAINTNLGIDASAYSMDEVAVAFWVYAKNAGALGSGEQLRIGSTEGTDTNAFGSNSLIYYYSDISLSAGWNYITLPLSTWKTDIKQEFSLSKINCFGFSQLSVDLGQVLYFGDFQLIVLQEDEGGVEEVTEWEIFKPSTVQNAGTLNIGTTTTAEGPGAGTEYFILDASTSAINGFGTRNSYLGINAGAYTQEELALAFWVYSNHAGTLGTGDNLRLGNVTYLGETPFLYYMYGEIPVEAGWNYIELPLSDWHQDAGTGFSTSALNCFGFTNFNLAVGEVRWFTDFKIIVLGDDSETIVKEGNIEVTKNISSVAENYMIFSNANATSESNPFALYVTKEGYPAVLYGTTQFVLNQSVATGEDVTIKAAVNSSKQVEFYIDGSLVATSKTTVSSQGAPTTPYSIGADGVGAQNFVGTLKDVKAYSDAAASACIGNWPLVGDIRYVVEAMPDASGNGNNATFKGTRANDWYDVEKAADDEWSLVFIPDIVQRFYRGEHATWHKMAKWIANNVSKENIKYVIGAKTADLAQADAANIGYELFDNCVPTTNFNTAEDNSYYRFQVNGVKWMILSLKKGWDSDATAVFTWGKEIIAKYPHDNVIITCDNYYNSVWGEFNSVNQNVKLIVYGSQVGAPSEDAPVMNFPAQNDLENNYFGEQGLGLLYMLRFTENGTKVTARSFAPIYDSYFTGVVNYEKTIVTETAPEVLNMKYTGATPGTAPTDVPEGYLFAGWFKPEVAAEWTLHSGIYFSGVSMSSGSYITTEADEPGAGMECFVLDATDAAISGFDAFQNQEEAIDVSSYAKDKLAISFWVYSNTTGKLAPDYNGGQIRLGNSSVYENCLFYYMHDIDVVAGWNHVEIPLSKFHTDIEGTFTLAEVASWGILDGHDVPKGTILRYGDIKLVATGTNGSAEYALKEATTDTVYARFVDADLLDVKAQISINTNDMSNYTDIRFVTSVDRLEYQTMGFEITNIKDNGEPNKKVYETKYVYESLKVMDETGKKASYSPSQVIAASAQYFKAYTIQKVPNRAFDRKFTVRAYWITLDGTKVYGETVDKTVWGGYPTNKESLPKIVKTNYPTDDVVIAEIVVTEEKYGYLDDVVDGDWTVAIQNALNDCHNMGGGTVYVPAGEYKLTDSITVPSNVTLRGDWQDPDVGTEYGTIFNIYPREELNVNRNADASHNGTAAFEMNGSSGVIGITAYYPEQSVGSVKQYPYTFYVTNDASQLITLKNITVLNGYRGIGTSYEVQHECLIIDNFKGTFLDCGMALYNASDAGRVTGVSISSKYWEAKDGTDASDYVLANATGMEIGDLEWQQFSNCFIDGYNTGISVVGGYRINFVGSMIDMSITNCATGITIAEKNDTIYYAGTDDDKTSYPLDRAMDPRWGTVIARSTIEGNIANNTMPEKTTVSLINYKISQTSALLRMTDVSYDSTKVSDKDYSGEWNSFDTNVKSTSEDLGDSTNAQYDASYVKPLSNLWVVDLEAYDGANIDVSDKINEAMDKVLERNASGGIVYIPGGTYRLDNPITVPTGVELRGVSAVANREQYNDCEGTLFMCYYGDDSTSTTRDTALITLAGDGAGVNGLRFIYPENIITYDADVNSTYTIAAQGVANVHVVNCYIITSSYGVNLTDCDNFFIEGVYSCVYKNTFNVSGDNGIIRGCLANPNMIVRTSAEGLTSGWPTEATHNNTTADINKIRNSLKNELNYIAVTGGNVLIQDVTAYAVNTLISNTGATTVVLNSNADCMDDASGAQFNVASGTLTVINALRAAVTDSGEAATATLYTHGGGTLNIYNSIMAKADEDASAYENNYSATK